MKLVLALLLAAVPSAPAFAQDKADAAQAARTTTLARVVSSVSAKQPKEAVALVDPLLAEYERVYAGEKGRLYCDEPTSAAAGYATLPGGSSARVVEDGWCMALWAKGFALIDLDQLDAAVPYLERAVTMAPLHPHYLSELGYAYQAQKQWQRSYDAYARAADSASKLDAGERRTKFLRRAWFGMGFDLIELGRLDEAEAMMKKCLELVPGDAKVQRELDFIREQRSKKS